MKGEVPHELLGFHNVLVISDLDRTMATSAAGWASLEIILNKIIGRKMLPSEVVRAVYRIASVGLEYAENPNGESVLFSERVWDAFNKEFLYEEGDTEKFALAEAKKALPIIGTKLFLKEITSNAAFSYKALISLNVPPYVEAWKRNLGFDIAVPHAYDKAKKALSIYDSFIMNCPVYSAHEEKIGVFVLGDSDSDMDMRFAIENAAEDKNHRNVSVYGLKARNHLALEGGNYFRVVPSSSDKKGHDYTLRFSY